MRSSFGQEGVHRGDSTEVPMPRMPENLHRRRCRGRGRGIRLPALPLGCPSARRRRLRTPLPVHVHSGFATLPKSTPVAISRGRKCCSTWRIPLTRLGSVSPQSWHWWAFLPICLSTGRSNTLVGWVTIFFRNMLTVLTDAGSARAMAEMLCPPVSAISIAHRSSFPKGWCFRRGVPPVPR